MIKEIHHAQNLRISSSVLNDVIMDAVAVSYTHLQRKMSTIEASIVLAGIELDTKNFTKTTTERTFEAAAYLRSRGADNLSLIHI